jgi:hypothetical protein
MTDLMVDIETVSTWFDAAIIQVGWCKFHPDTGEIDVPARAAVDLNSCLRLGMSVDGKTIAWWMEQEDAARSVFQAKGSDIRQVLSSLALAAKGCQHVWACPPQFDLSILKNAYRLVFDQRQPWNHRDERCLRTLCDLAGYDRRSGPRPTLPHDAGSDAEAQCKQYFAAMDKLREPKDG